MMPLYLAEMDSLKTTDPDILQEFLQGNWVVNKNEEVPFCAIGADHALEHINRAMKVSGGLVGIKLNASARTRFFLIAPELARLSSEAQELAGVKPTVPVQHHTMTTAFQSREEKSVAAVTDTLRRFTNPFQEKSEDLFNIVTKAVVSEKTKNDLCNHTKIGIELFNDFVRDRITSGKLGLWSPMKKQRLSTWRKVGKELKVKAAGKIIVLKEDRSLFARMMVVCKSRPEINMKDAIGLHEFSVVPRSLFAADGTMFHCTNKSQLMFILEALPGDQPAETANTQEAGVDVQGRHRVRVDIVDGMAEVQSLKKTDDVKNCLDLADHFVVKLFEKYRECDELRLIFDRYDIPLSLKMATRARRQGQQPAIAYRISDSTNISNATMKKLLSHVKTKRELSCYLARRTLEHGQFRGKRVVVAWSNQCQEEADTKIILHAIDATASGATTIRICSPDTDVFVLALRRYPHFCEDTAFVTGVGQRRRIISLKPIFTALGRERAAALPGFHAFSGADNTGSFYGKGKLTCWKSFFHTSRDVVVAFTDLGTTPTVLESTLAGIERFVCNLYLPNTQFTQVKDVRWWLFKKKQAQSECLPPTQSALLEGIKRAHYQALVWGSDTIPNPVIPSPQGYGWELEDNEWSPVMSQLLPAPEAIIHLIKCGCAKSRCSTNHCQCKKAGLNCIDLCKCSKSDDACENSKTTAESEDEEDDVNFSDDQTCSEDEDGMYMC